MLTLTFLALEQHYGKHSLRFSFKAKILSSADRDRSMLNSFKQSINKKDLTVLIRV